MQVGVARVEALCALVRAAEQRGGSLRGRLDRLAEALGRVVEFDGLVLALLRRDDESTAPRDVYAWAAARTVGAPAADVLDGVAPTPGGARLAYSLRRPAGAPAFDAEDRALLRLAQPPRARGAAGAGRGAGGAGPRASGRPRREADGPGPAPAAGHRALSSALLAALEHARAALPGRLELDARLTAGPGAGRGGAGLGSIHVRTVLDPEAPARLASAARAFALTRREAETGRLVAEGLTNREIAARLGISPATVKTHLERLLAKTGARSRGAAAAALLGVEPARAGA